MSENGHENCSSVNPEVGIILEKAIFTPTESHALGILTDEDLNIYCPGTGSGSLVEIKMAVENPQRKIILTSTDPKNVIETSKKVDKFGIKNIDVKNEDISKKLPYNDNSFDFVYARLLLHYLDKNTLDSTLLELKRILKMNGKIFITVRSTSDSDAQQEGVTFDSSTGFTSYPYVDESGQVVKDKKISRYLHTKVTITNHIENAGLKIVSISEIKEPRYLDYARTKKAFTDGDVIEIVVTKN